MRPTLYSDEMVEKARAYVGGGFSDCGDVVPTVAGIAIHLGISRPTVYEWAKEYPEFSYIVEECLARQEVLLVGGGLSGTYNATISKLLLNKHGYHEKQEIDNKSSDGSMTPTLDTSKLDTKTLEAIMKARTDATK